MSTDIDGAPRSRWSSRYSFILVASGFAVGLGNIWRFPYLTGENGGSAFVLVYLACAFGIGAPLIMAELLIGRRGGMDVIGSIRKVASEAGASPRWGWIGGLGLIATFLILAYYVVIAGWTLDYMVQSASGAMAGQSAAQSETTFDALMASPVRMAFWSACIVAISAITVARGITGGLERVARILMPMLLLGLIALAIYAGVVGDMSRAVDFLFTPDFSKIDAHTVLVAIGQAFFSVGVGFGTMISFGAYLDRDMSIAGVATTIVAADTAVALIAGLAIFPIVFGFGLAAGSGPGLVFVSMPIAFGTLPGGSFVGLFFFALLFAAAITSCIGLFEPLVSWVHTRRGLPRPRAIFITAFAIWLTSLATVFSLNSWDNFYPLAALAIFAESSIYAVQDFVAVNILLPLGALMTALFAGWVVARKTWWHEAQGDSVGVIGVWHMVMRYFVPLAILSIFASLFI